MSPTELSIYLGKLCTFERYNSGDVEHGVIDQRTNTGQYYYIPKRSLQDYKKTEEEGKTNTDQFQYRMSRNR
jgi:hypothetical protein